MNWWIWRLAASRFISDGYADIRYRWTFADTFEGLVAIEAMEEIHEIQNPPPKR